MLLTVLAVASGAGAEPSAVSADGRWQLQAQGLELVLRDASGVEARRWPTRAAQGGPASVVATLRANPPRRSFVVGFEHLAEVWELLLDPAAEAQFSGLVHDYRMGEGLSEPGFLALRRTRLPEPVQALALDRSGAWVLARGADRPDGRAVLHLLQLDIRQAAARFEVDADPDLALTHDAPCGERDCLRVPDRRGGPPLQVDVRAARLR